MPSTKVGVKGTVTRWPAANEAANGAPVSTSLANSFVSGRSALMAEAMPQMSPPPPYGAMTASTSGKSSRISRPITPGAGHHVRIAVGMNAFAGRAVALAGQEHRFQLCHRQLDRRRAIPDDVRQLHPRHKVRNVDSRWNPERAGRPGDGLRHVAGAHGPDAVRQGGFALLRHRVVGAAQLEGANRLQAFQLEVDLRAEIVRIKPHQRRAENDAPRPLTRGADLFERNRIPVRIGSVHDRHSSAVPTGDSVIFLSPS